MSSKKNTSKRPTTKRKKTASPAASAAVEKKSSEVIQKDVFAFDDELEQEKLTSTTEVVFEDSFGERDERFADDLSAIYESGGGKNEDVDMNTFDQKRKRGKIIAMICAGVILLGVISYIGYLVFHSAVSDEESGSVDFAMVTPQEIASGELITVELSYTNNKPVNVSGDIELFYPSGFIYKSATVEPENGKENTFHVDTLAAGKTETITITGQLIGSTNVEKEFSALFTYQPSNFSSDFQEKATSTVHITSSLIDVSIEAPEQVQSGEEFTIVATFENTSDSEMSAVTAQMVYPKGFTVKSTEPEGTESNKKWMFKTVAPHSDQTISVTGTLTGESGSAQDIQFQVGIMEMDQTFTLQAEETIQITVVNPEIDISLDAPQVAAGGSTVPVSVTVNNTSSAQLQDVSILLALDEDFFEDSEQTLSIDDLPAGESTTLTADVSIQENPDSDDREGTITATIPSAFVEGATVTFPNEATASMKLQGSFAITVTGGSPDTEGEVPTVGETSFYTIYWTIENGSETVEGFRVSTSLPDGVEWAGDASQGVVYDSATGEVSYEKETLAASFEKEIAFTVSVTPESDDVGSTMQITYDTTAVGVDGFTDQDISFAYPALQTDTAVVRSTQRNER